MSIVNGDTISESEFPSINQLSGCTGIFVSDSTLLYATHYGKTATLPKKGNKKTTSVFSKGDIAVALILNGTATDFISIINRTPKAGEKIRLIGYGKAVFGTKRTATNTFVEFGKNGA